ncbi:ribosomal protein S5 domain 2-type protein [Dunaliella salina]|uniref:Ribosomal protein S5 domain 2-type protein n=1 Tax=Dunaliella salina TaxID=3046 RepID=A0ABQ7H844_DUNSA|nr:ribosomal protein S5 domain 2-type protein [Dunaliella salina]|eukprot:KAF5843025.1 ribosomal protein S5 domain 2-type protein [Dunaliella salina]
MLLHRFSCPTLPHRRRQQRVKDTLRPIPYVNPSRCRQVHVQASSASVQPVLKEAAAFAPATVANLGPGYDWMGCAVEGGGDVVVARALPDKPGQVVIEKIDGDNGRLTLDPTKNCIGIAASETMKLIGNVSFGVSLTLQKGLPLGSGLGSSAASAAAAAWAVNGLFGEAALSKRELILAGLEAEAAVSGYHADNVGPSLMGGFILIRWAHSFAR